MEMQLQELIEKIKQDGVAAAEKEAAAIVEAARAEAEKILSEAQAQAEASARHTREENARFVSSGEDAIRQAGRNLMISFRESVSRELDGVVSREVSAALDSQTLGELIPRAVEAWCANTDAQGAEVLLNSRDLAALEEGFLAALQQRLGQGVTLKADDRFAGGFRIAQRDGGAYYDFSAPAVADMLSAYLNPRVSALLKEAGQA